MVKDVKLPGASEATKWLDPDTYEVKGRGVFRIVAPNKVVRVRKQVAKEAQK